MNAREAINGTDNIAKEPTSALETGFGTQPTNNASALKATTGAVTHACLFHHAQADKSGTETSRSAPA